MAQYIYLIIFSLVCPSYRVPMPQLIVIDPGLCLSYESTRRFPACNRLIVLFLLFISKDIFVFVVMNTTFA